MRKLLLIGTLVLASIPAGYRAFRRNSCRPFTEEESRRIGSMFHERVSGVNDKDYGKLNRALRTMGYKGPRIESGGYTITNDGCGDPRHYTYLDNGTPANGVSIPAGEVKEFVKNRKRQEGH